MSYFHKPISLMIIHTIIIIIRVIWISQFQRNLTISNRLSTIYNSRNNPINIIMNFAPPRKERMPMTDYFMLNFYLKSLRPT